MSERNRHLGVVDLGKGALRFDIGRLAELQEALGASGLGEILQRLQDTDLVVIGQALKIGEHKPVGDVSVTEATARVIEAVTLAVFGPDGPPETDETEEGNGKNGPSPAGDGATKSGSPVATSH